MRTAAYLLLGAFVGLLLLVVALFAIDRFTGSEPFVRRWSQELAAVIPPASVETTMLPSLVTVRRFPNDEWVAARSASSCPCGEGGNFDAIVFVDSTGRSYFDVGSELHGPSGALALVSSIDASSAADFREGLDVLVLNDL